MTFGGGPARKLNCRKPPSLETIAKPRSRANDQMARSSAALNPISMTCAESG